MNARIKNLLLISAWLLGLVAFAPSAFAGLCITISASGAGSGGVCGGADTAIGGTGTGGDGGDVVIKDGGGSEILKLPLNPSSPLRTPAGWSGPTSPPAVGTPPVTWFSGNTGSTFFNNRPAAATYGCGLAGRGAGVAKNDTHYECATPYGGAGVAYQTQARCDAGYTASGGACGLTTPADVIKPVDNLPGYKRVGNTLVPDAQDPDNATMTGGASPNGTVSQPTPNVVQLDTPDGRRVKVTIGGDGKTTVEVTNPTPNGNTQKEEVKIGAPGGGGADGKVEGRSITTTQGSGTGGTGGALDAGENCPAGPCATETTLAAIKANVAAGVKQDEQVGSWLTSPTAVTAAQVAARGVLDALKTSGDTAASSGHGTDLFPALGNITIAGVKSSVLSFWDTYFPTSAECAPFSPAASGRWAGMSINLCPVVNPLRPVLEWGLVLLTALSIYSSWFGGRAHRPGAATGNY